MIPGQHFDIRSAAVSVSADKVLQDFPFSKASSMSAMAAQDVLRRLHGCSVRTSFLALLSLSLESPSFPPLPPFPPLFAQPPPCNGPFFAEAPLFIFFDGHSDDGGRREVILSIATS